MEDAAGRETGRETVNHQLRVANLPLEAHCNATMPHGDFSDISGLALFAGGVQMMGWPRASPISASPPPTSAQPCAAGARDAVCGGRPFQGFPPRRVRGRRLPGAGRDDPLRRWLHGHPRLHAGHRALEHDQRQAERHGLVRLPRPASARRPPWLLSGCPLRPPASAARAISRASLACPPRPSSARRKSTLR